MKVKVRVKDNCIGCGACVSICPNVFQFNESGKSYAVKQPETEEELKCSKEAESACPVNAIVVEESN